MRINILLPTYSRVFSGGYKVAFEYAAYLATHGHEVRVVLPWAGEEGISASGRARKLAGLVKNWRRPVPWFTFPEGVRLLFPSTLDGKGLPDADVTLCTAFQTAEAARHFPASAGRRWHLVYDYEFWMTGDAAARARMAEVFRADSLLIATSPAVQEMLTECGATWETYIPCGLDAAAFGLDVPIEQRNAGAVGFPVRPEPFKGTGDAITALMMLRDRLGDRLSVTAFGSSSAARLPEWMQLCESPDAGGLRRFYNGLAVFVLPSHFEGWGLPGIEAQRCGAALAATDSGGVRGYAEDGVTALLSPARRPDLLAEHVERLVVQDEARRSLASAGHARSQEFTWERAGAALAECLESGR